MALVILTTIKGLPLKVNPSNVRQVLGTRRAVVYLTSGIDVEIRESRIEALDRITAPRRRT